MSLQEGKLTGIAADLRKLVDKYHGAIDTIQLAEEELMLPELKITQTSLNPGKYQFFSYFSVKKNSKNVFYVDYIASFARSFTANVE